MCTLLISRMQTNFNDSFLEYQCRGSARNFRQPGLLCSWLDLSLNTFYLGIEITSHLLVRVAFLLRLIFFLRMFFCCCCSWTRAKSVLTISRRRSMVMMTWRRNCSETLTPCSSGSTRWRMKTTEWINPRRKCRLRSRVTEFFFISHMLRVRCLAIRMSLVIAAVESSFLNKF